ncbi:hypothetical protein SAAL107622_10145 [Lacicoccus alkaliphilus]
MVRRRSFEEKQEIVCLKKRKAFQYEYFYIILYLNSRLI